MFDSACRDKSLDFRCPSHCNPWRRRYLSAFATLVLLTGSPHIARAQSEPSLRPAGQLTRAPELKHFVTAKPGPDAPSLANAITVRLQFSVLANGTVADVVVLNPGDPVLDTAAAKAAEAFVFIPAEVDGVVAAVRIQYEYVYQLPLSATQPTVATPTPAPRAPSTVPSGTLRGQWLQSGTRQPIAGGTVRLPQLGLETLTDAEGRFEFKSVPAGLVRLALTDEEQVTLDDTEEVRARAITDVTYYAEPTGFGTDDLLAIGRKLRKQVVRRDIAIGELETVPGSNGDALKAVQNLPGIARSNGDDLVMRGVGNSRVFLNGHPISEAFHFGGLRSTIANGLIRELEVTPGNYDARYGGTNSGIVDIQTRRPSSSGLHGYAQVDVFDASVFVEGPVGDNGVFALGLRRSYIDGVLQLALDDDELKTFQVAPKYSDFQASYDWKKGRQRFRLNTLGASDKMVLLFDEPDESEPAARGSLDLSVQWLVNQALWDYRVDEKTKLSVGVSHLWEQFNQSFGELLVDFSRQLITTRADIHHRLAPWFQLRAGIDSSLRIDEYEVKVPRPPGEGRDSQFNLSTSDYLSSRGSPNFYKPGGYLAADLQFGPVALTPAVRVEHFGRADNLQGTLVIQPRVDARLALAHTTTLKAGLGWYSEANQLVETDAVYGNPDIQPSHSRHFSAGVEQQFGAHLSLDITGFYQDLYRQVSRLDDPELKYDNRGRGRVFGGEFLLKHSSSSRFYGWLAYTAMRSERRDSGANHYRLYTQDQTHNLNIVAQYKLTPTWELGARFRYGTGNPTTPIVRAVYDSDGDTYTPVLGTLNAARFAAFHQLDVRVDKHWRFDTWRLTTYLDVQNIYNSRNSGSIAYNYNYRQSKPEAGLPIIPSFGVKGQF